MSSGVMNFKDSFLWSNKFYGQLYRPVTFFRASAQYRLRSLDTAIGGSSKDVLCFTLCAFSALQS